MTNVILTFVLHFSKLYIIIVIIRNRYGLSNHKEVK